MLAWTAKCEQTKPEGRNLDRTQKIEICWATFLLKTTQKITNTAKIWDFKEGSWRDHGAVIQATFWSFFAETWSVWDIFG